MNVLLKKIDLYGQLAMLVIPLILSIIFSIYYLFWAYISVGGWQLLSAILHHEFCAKPYYSTAREKYMWILVVVLLLGGLSFIAGLFVILYALLYLTAFMAVWYFLITKRELQAWQHKAWIHLK